MIISYQVLIEFLQIFYSDSLYHTYQYVSDYKLIYV